MIYKKIYRKVRFGLYEIRERGVLNFLILSLQYAQKRYGHNGYNRHKLPIYTKAIFSEIIDADLSIKQPKNRVTRSKKLRLNWLMPPPGKGSGGHMTLFRFIGFLEKAGHECRIYLHNPGPASTVKEVKSSMGESFPKLKAEMKWLREGDAMLPADGVFATSWETAYSVFSPNIRAKKFYFVQDFEPYFYPVGSHYVLAENTYKFGFYGITAGGWLAKKLREEYGMTTDYFTFGADKTIYNYKNKSARKEILFYVRPFTERRGFELGILALYIFHKKHPDYVINFLGWDVSDYNIPFPYNNLKLLEHDQLDSLYNVCAAGLVMSLTNMSLLPLELLSSGCIPVVNDGENNRLVSDNKYISYANNYPEALASKLSEIVKKKNLLDYSYAASQSVDATSWEDSGARLVNIVEREIRKKS